MIIRMHRPRNQALLLLCSLALLAFGLDNWQRMAQQAGNRMWLDSIIASTASPLQAGLTQVTSLLRREWAMIVNARLLARENAELESRVAELRAKLRALEEKQGEIEREQSLRAAYAGQDRMGRMAHVVAVGVGGWLSYLVVDRGRAEGIRQRDIAATRDGVVGQVYAIGEHTANVLPITDPASGVAVRVRGSRETGILKGAGLWRCHLFYLGPHTQVCPGDELLTAGTGGVYPKGLPVGRVISVARDPNTSGKMARVEPAARLPDVEEVLLLRAPRLAEWP